MEHEYLVHLREMVEEPIELAPGQIELGLAQGTVSAMCACGGVVRAESDVRESIAQAVREHSETGSHWEWVQMGSFDLPALEMQGHVAVERGMP